MTREQKTGILFDMAMAADSSGDMRDATALYRAAWKESGFTDVDSLINLGRCYSESEQPRKALRCFKHAVKIAGFRGAVVWFNLGCVYHHLGMTDKAAFAYRKALAIEATFEDARFNYGILAQGSK